MTSRLVNCDFLNVSGFMSNLSNKGKLLYFFFLTNADDKGFVGNAIDLANTLDRCEENFENVLFTYKYVDAIKELVDKRLVYEFKDKVGNKTYLIRHWFYHNNYKPYLKTLFISYMAQVELVDNEYHLKNHQKDKEEEPYKEKQIKVNKSKVNFKEQEDILDNNIQEQESDNWEEEWEKTLKELSSIDN